jgi:hypothetical protein
MWAGAYRLNGFYLLEGEYHFRALKSYLLGFWHHPVSILPDWKRIVYAAFAPLGLKFLKKNYYRQKKRKILKRYDNDNNKRKI